MRVGKRTGHWVFRNEDGGKNEGSFEDGLRQGLWTFDGGRRETWSKSNYLDDKKHGEQSHGQGRFVHSWTLMEHGEFVKHLRVEKLGRQ